MERIGYQGVNEHLGLNESYDIMNAIRNEASEQFKHYVPLANAKNVADVGAGLLTNRTLQNEFITALVERIGKVIIRKVTLKNPLAKFKKGTLEYGRTIEEIYTDISEEHLYDPEVAETEVFKREIPDVKTLFHEVNREGFFKQTVQDGNLKRAFTSWNDFGDFVGSIITSMYNSDEVHEYRYMMLAIDNAHSKGLFKVEKVDPVLDGTSGKAFVKSVRKAVRKMTMPAGSRGYNAMAIHTRSETDNLHLFITADLEAEIDVEVLSAAFNMDYTNFLGKITIVDQFASPGLEALLIDEDALMFYDVLFGLETQRNSQGLYWNYFLHHHQLISVSRFGQAVAFVTSDEAAPVTSVIVDPPEASITAGREMKFTSYVRQTDEESRSVTWNVETYGGMTKRQATQIDSDGILKVADNQEGQLKVTAKTTYEVPGDGDLPETVEVIGESVVHVKPAK